MTAGCKSVQATVIAIDGRGVLLQGPSGVGKSDLALRLIDAGAALVADDLVMLDQRGPWLTAIAPSQYCGRLFVSGVGIVTIASFQPEVRLSLAVSCRTTAPMGYRGPTLGQWRSGGAALPEVALVARAPSAPNQLRLALDRWGL